MKVSIYLISYSRGGRRYWWPESLNKKQAYAIAKVLDEEGLEPRVVKTRIRPSMMFEAAESTRTTRPMSPRPEVKLLTA